MTHHGTTTGEATDDIALAAVAAAVKLATAVKEAATTLNHASVAATDTTPVRASAQAAAIQALQAKKARPSHKRSNNQ